MFPPHRHARWLPGLVVGALAVIAVVGAIVAFGRQGDEFDPGVEFDAAQTQATAPPPPPERPAATRHPSDDRFAWPVYGYTKQRTHALALRTTPRPPFRRAWAVRGDELLEFTPVLCERSLFLLKNNGALYSISRLDGEVRWKRKLGDLAAASPACGDDSVYAVLLARGRGVDAGRVAALSASTGRTRWSRKLPSRAESSPLLDRGRLFFGTEDGTVYALRARDGKLLWRYRAAGAVKGALALDRGRLFFGDYGGRVHAIDRDTGRRVWTTGTEGRLGGRSGNFYSSPAVAYGRVYIGNTDGFVYSFSARTGKLAWRKRTGGFVYASPAVAEVDGAGPTVYIGSYDGTFYALNARTGSVRWDRRLGTKISGAATVIGDLVFVSELAQTATWALGARTGQTVWKTDRGAFNPAIGDGRRIYFLGYSSLFALDPAGVRYDARGAERRSRQIRDRREERAAARRRAREERSRKYRQELHGHEHSNGRDGRHCHDHRHTYRIGGRVVSRTHDHCHAHTEG